MADKLALLTIYTRDFIRKAKRLIDDGNDYEPPENKSHQWANLCSVIEHAEDTLMDIDDETAAAIASSVREHNSSQTSREE